MEWSCLLSSNMEAFCILIEEYDSVLVASYYAPLVNLLVAKGYTRGVDVLGAPYDFRKAPSQLSSIVSQ